MKTKCIVSLVMMVIVATPCYAAYLLEENWDIFDGWADDSINGGISEIDPAGELHLDCTGLTDDGYARRIQDIGEIGAGDYYVEFRFKGDTWDGWAGIWNGEVRGIQAFTNGPTYALYCWIGNDFTDGDGIYLHDGAAYHLVYEHTWDDNWHTVVFYVHNSQTDVDIWVDKDPRTEAADATDGDCSFGTSGDGLVRVQGIGSLAGDGEYHVDCLYIIPEPTTIFLLGLGTIFLRRKS